MGNDAVLGFFIFVDEKSSNINENRQNTVTSAME